MRICPLMTIGLFAAQLVAASPFNGAGPRPPMDPCARDVAAPRVDLRLSAGAGGLEATADVLDACGVALVLFAVDGNVVGGRVREPWSITLVASPGDEICALAADRAGNSALDCEVLAPPAACDEDAECRPDEYCHFPDGTCAGPGTCELRPDACTADYEPACGCDGITYSNPCVAASF